MDCAERRSACPALRSGLFRPLCGLHIELGCASVRTRDSHPGHRSPIIRKPRAGRGLFDDGGEGGIRTHEGLSPLLVFKTSAFNRSATSPSLVFELCLNRRPSAGRERVGLTAPNRVRLALRFAAGCSGRFAACTSSSPTGRFNHSATLRDAFLIELDPEPPFCHSPAACVQRVIDWPLLSNCKSKALLGFISNVYGFDLNNRFYKLR